MFRRFMLVLLVFISSSILGLSACSKSEEPQKNEDDFWWHYRNCAEDPEFYNRFELWKSEYFEMFPDAYPRTDEEIKDSLYHRVWSCECFGDILVKFGGASSRPAGQRQVLNHYAAECVNDEQRRKVLQELESRDEVTVPETK